MHKLTGKQCKQARALLKWNVYDLAGKVNGINPKRIESYERGMVHVAEWENKEMVSAFRKEGVQFNDEMDVSLAAADKVSSAVRMGGGEGAHIKLDGAGEIVSDSTANAIPELIKPKDEDKPDGAV